MRIVYDDLAEFAEVRIRCENTRHKSMCKYCPFYDRCEIDDNEKLHTMCGEIAKALNLSKCYGDSGVYFEHDIEADIAELKKKYTEGKYEN